MSKHSKVDQPLIEDFQRRYFSAFSCIGSYNKQDYITPHWHNSVRNQLRDTASLTTLLGRRRQFFGRSDDAETLRAAIAYEPQSLTADEIDTALLRLWQTDRVQLLLQVHDSILFQYPEEREDEIIPWAVEAARVTIPSLPIATSAFLPRRKWDGIGATQNSMGMELSKPIQTV